MHPKEDQYPDLPDETEFDEPDMPDGQVPEPEPPGGVQDPDAPLGGADDARALALFAQPVAPRNAPEAITWYAGQHTNPAQDYHALCLQFSRLGRDIPAQQPYAYAGWLAVDDDSKHVGGNPDDAPLGAFLFFKGVPLFGHIMPGTRDFPSGRGGAWSNDLVRDGQIDKVLRTAPVTRWGQRYLGWTSELNGYDLQVGKVAPPKPKDTHPYKALERAAHNIGVALDTAKAEHDAADVEKLRALIKRTEVLSHKLKHS